MPWNYLVMLLGITCNGPGSTMAQQLRQVVSSPLVPMEPSTEVTLRVHRVEITSVLSGTLFLESRHSAGRYRLLLRVRSHFSIIGISSWTDINKQTKKTIKPKAVLLMQSLKKKMNSSLSFGQGALTFGFSKAISCLSKSVIIILLEDDLAETFSQVSFKSYFPRKNISFPLRTTGFDFFSPAEGK